MSQQHRSISQRLAKAKLPAVKQEVALDWAASWQKEYDVLIYQLEEAIKKNDYDNLCITTGQLKAVGRKRFGALSNVLQSLSPIKQVE